VIGTVGILEAAAERGLLDLEQAFHKVKQTDFWVSPKFLDERLALYRERRLDREQQSGRS
jgi:predicted nucleic acid-binding protein